MQLIWKWLYNTSSSKDHGTLYQLKNLINRKNVKTHPKDDFRACDDFFVLVVKCHILAAAMEILNIDSLDEIPEGAECDWILPDEDRKIKLERFCNKLIERFVKLGLLEDKKPDTNDAEGDKMESDDESEANDDHESESDTDSENESEQKSVTDDGVLQYAKDLISLGLLYLEYRDGVKEGDGIRVVCCWKFWLPLFKVSEKKNYSIEALQTIFNYKFVLSDMHAQQWLYSRFVNTQGRPGCNIPADEHQEHLNRVCKDSISHLGANKTKESINRVGKCVGMISKVTENLDKQLCIAKTSGKHTVSSSKKDMDMIVKELVESEILTSKHGRKHSVCTKRSIYDKVSKLEMRDWVKKHTQL